MTESNRPDDDVATAPAPAETKAAADAEPQAEPGVREDSAEPAPAERPESEQPAPEDRPKKKGSRERRSDAAEDLAARPLDAKGRERPLFLTKFPEDPELSRLVAAFEAGNYALVRSDAERLAERTSDPRVRDAALELRRRIDPDPLIKYLLGLALALFMFLVFYSYHLH